MEKKLTDEEIVKALGNCKKDNCIDCPYFINEYSCKANTLLADTLDLIHRLQDENKRLTKEHERIAWSKQEYMDWVHGFLSTHTDMKDRGEKFEAFDRDWMCNVFWKKIVGALEYIIDLEKQRNELQKQVDDLKAELEKAYEIERANIQAEIAEAGTSCHWCKQQAVKDTAEKVFNEVMSCIGSLQMFWIVDGKARTLVDAEKLFEESCKIAKKHGIFLDEEETKDKAKTMQWSKFEVE